MRRDLPFLPERPGEGEPFLIAGPCVVESEALVFEVAEHLKTICDELGVRWIFKASFDKANRSSHLSFRGLGMAEGLRILERVRADLDIPVLTDVHEGTPIGEVADVVDVLQTPAFLVRQTDFMQRVAAAGRPVNVKKGQFQAPWDMKHVVAKMRAAGGQQILLCERGVTHGYNRLVVDMPALVIMRETGCPVVMDATHGVQLPGGEGSSSGGVREFVPILARAAMAVGVDGLFMETHPRPQEALSDGPNMWPLWKMRELLEGLLEISRVARPLAYGGHDDGA